MSTQWTQSFRQTFYGGPRSFDHWTTQGELMNDALRVIYFAAMTALTAACGSAATDAEDHALKLNPQNEQAAKQRRTAIDHEWKSLGRHPWAGSYFHGDGLGVNVVLDLAPSSGFVFQWSGCLGTYDRNFGGVSAANGILTLQCELPNPEGGFRGIDTILCPIPWGERVYLVAPEKIPDFCSAVNWGEEPRSRRHGRFLLRVNDEITTVTGKPSVPAEYERLIRTTPIMSAVISVDHTTTWTGHNNRGHFIKKTVTLDGGSDQGILVGQKLRTTPANGSRDSFTVGDVAETTCTASTVRYGYFDTTPTLGMILTSGAMSKP
jgi:hypothetical protein